MNTEQTSKNIFTSPKDSLNALLSQHKIEKLLSCYYYAHAIIGGQSLLMVCMQPYFSLNEINLYVHQILHLNGVLFSHSK